MPDPVDSSDLLSQRPTLEVDGVAAGELEALLLELEVLEDVAGRARLRARFGNLGNTGRGVGYLHFDDGKLELGGELEVNAGDPPVAGRIFAGRISALEGLYPEGHPPALEVRAEDGLERLRTARQGREFRDSSVRAVVTDVAQEHGLQTEIAFPGADAAHELIAQAHESDLEFLRRLARVHGAFLWLDGDTLHFRDGWVDPNPLSLELGEQLVSCAVRADLADQVTALTVLGWDLSGDEPIEEVADDSQVDTTRFGQHTGAAVLKSTLGSRRGTLGRKVPLTRDEARTLAEAAFLRRADRFLTAEGVARGDSRLRPGRLVALEGLGPWFDGTYELRALRHVFDAAEGYRTHFTAVRPALDEIGGMRTRHARRPRRRRGPGGIAVPRPIPGAGRRGGTG